MPKWKQPVPGNNRMRVLEIKELAVENGLQFAEAILSKLKEEEDGSQRIMVAAFKDRIETLLKDVEQCPIYVGFIGGTGVGKSTLINALVEDINLLPTDSTKACTATVVLLAYNKSNDTNFPYRAEVEFANAEEWQEELEVSFRDIAAHFSHSGPTDGEDYNDRKKRIEDTLVTLRVVYPHLKSIEDLRTTSVAKLMEDVTVRKLLSTVKEITRPNKASFVKAIRPYIASVDEKTKAYCWPLIKCVKLFTKATILKTGLVLVDLPGNMERNTTRGSIAMKFLKNLTAPIILANSGRGIDDQNAHQLLESVMKTDLQLDGTYTRGNLCFVLTQFDRSFNANDYIRHNPTLRQSIQPLLDDHKAKRSILNEREQELRAVRKRKRSADDGDTDRPSSTGGVRDAKDTIAILQNSIGHLKTGVAYAQSKIVVACNDDRKMKSTAAVRADFENNLRDMGKAAAETVLHVFCTAAPVYLDFCNPEGRTRTLGLPTKQSTEIPQLRDWLYQLTIPERSLRAEKTLNNIELLIGSMKPWIDDRTGDIKMTQLQKQEGELISNASLQQLKKKLSAVEAQTKEDMVQIVHREIYSQMPTVEKLAAKSSLKEALAWGKLAWNTNKAINQRRGDWVNAKKGTQYMWNALLARTYKKQPLFKRAWNRTFNELFTAVMLLHATKVEKLIVEFAQTFADIEVLSSFKTPLDLLKEQLLKTSKLLPSQTHNIIGKIESRAKEAHRLAEPEIKKYLIPVYDECGAEGGIGLYDRNRARHQNAIGDHGVMMHHEITKAIQGAINDLLKNVPAMISQESSAVIIRKLDREMAWFFEHNSTHGTRTAPRKLASPGKIKLQDALDASIESLMEAWNKGVDIRIEECEDEDDMEFEISNRFGLAVADDENDEDYEDDGS